MTKKTKLSRMAAWLLILALLLGSFPVVYSEGAEEEAPAENVTEVIQEAAPEVTEPEPAPAPVEAEPEPAQAEEPVQEPAPVQEQEPAAEEPAVEEPAAEEPAAEVPAGEEPAAEEPAAEEPAAEEPVAEEPAAEEPVAEEPTEQEPAEEPETTPGPEETPGEISDEISGSPAPEMDDEFDDFGDEDDEFDEDFDHDDDFDEFDEFEAESGNDGEEAAESSSGDEELVEFGEYDAGSVSDEFLEPFNNLDEYVQVEFNGCADIELKNDGDLFYGDEIILQAKVQDTNVSYRLIWEANDGDERGWYTVGSGDEYSYTLSEENVDRGYRVVIYTVD